MDHMINCECSAQKCLLEDILPEESNVIKLSKLATLIYIYILYDVIDFKNPKYNSLTKYLKKNNHINYIVIFR